MSEFKWIYVGVTKDTGALGFTEDLVKANNNFETPFNSYIPSSEHYKALTDKDTELQNISNKNKELKIVFNHQCDELRKYLNSFDDGRYLGKRLSAAIIEDHKSLIEALKIVKEALKFYADKENYSKLHDFKGLHKFTNIGENSPIQDDGKIARKTLEGIKILEDRYGE